ncbi:RusA family crossover junction endodeoxyribonuclease [Bradyrhizobium daqingense]|uniref:RusA family crossover junction endodeoxyribonuclease n=1 Tax=Bradyrhizobium daqingense TaxID=993502 RepID=UPI0038376BA6
MGRSTGRALAMLLSTLKGCRSLLDSVIAKLGEKPKAYDQASREVVFDISDGMEPLFPVELLLEAVPISLQASAASRASWKAEIRTEIDNVLDPAGWATQSPVRVTIFYFPAGDMFGDIDNIVKPILDGLMPRVYSDDNQVERVCVEKFEPDRAFQFEDPTPKLAAAIEIARPVLYIRIDNETSSED